MADRSAVRAVLTIVLAAVLVALVAPEPGYYAHETAAGDYLKKIDVGGRLREYRLHLPSGYDGTQRLPLLLAFHGSSATASVLERETSLDDVADSLGFIVAYPEGLYRSWNIGECCRYAFAAHVDDMAFVSSLLDHLEANLSVDSTRVFAAGYSDGGTLSFLLACNLSTRITAIAAVSATLFNPLPACDISRPIPVLIIHGTADTNIPYNGQPGATADARTQHRTLSAQEVVQFWVSRNGCVAPPRTTRAGRVLRTEYDCDRSVRVLFYTIKGGEHGWPGGGRGWIFSPVPPADMDATDSVVTFFLHPRATASLVPATERTSVVPALRRRVRVPYIVRVFDTQHPVAMATGQFAAFRRMNVSDVSAIRHCRADERAFTIPGVAVDCRKA